MIVSTKGRYALRVMLCLAKRDGGEYIPLKEIAEAEGISQKYLESIMTALSKAGFVDAVHGKGGGYRLNRAPAAYTVGSILKLTEGNLAPVACLEGPENHCERCDECPTLDFWSGLYAVVNDYIDRFTLADLLAEQQRKQHGPASGTGAEK